MLNDIGKWEAETPLSCWFVSYLSFKAGNDKLLRDINPAASAHGGAQT